MITRISKTLVEQIGYDKLAPYGLKEEDFRWREKAKELNLPPIPLNALKKLIEYLTPFKKTSGASKVIRDINLWIEACSNANQATVKSIRHFEGVLTNFLQDVPGHRVYIWNDGHQSHDAFFVTEISYTPPKKTQWGVTPAYVSMNYVCTELGETDARRHKFNEPDCIGKTANEILLRSNIKPETPELRAEYLAAKKRYEENWNQVGKQFLAVGLATDNLDGNKKEEDHWWRHYTTTIQMDKEGMPSRVVIDILNEEDDTGRDKRTAIDGSFWKAKKPPSADAKLKRDDDDDDEEELEETDDDEAGSDPNIEVPDALILACFDLRRHKRIRIHINQLTEYQYDPTLGEKLILPSKVTALIATLLKHEGGFKDIIGTKGGGAIILCAGKPGTGKTLTAEVYAEVMGKALYSVQCSQLGTTPEDLEGELLRTFARAQRWKAILLLDEADVYVATRGKDLIQNAIVGVFLRVLEYYQGVLFLTTNRSDLVDDAVASRCLAKINYSTPDTESQRKIWFVLARTAGLNVSNETVEQAIVKFPNLTGRDIKNLLKLARCACSGKEIDLETIAYLKEFKPTED